MQSLWFKACYVDAIRRGLKTQTIRKASDRPSQNVKPGDIIPASVGPRKPFAELFVTEISYLPLHRFSPREQVDLAGEYPGCETLKIIHFRLHRWLDNHAAPLMPQLF